MQPIDAQTNGPQLLYGLRYLTRIVQPGAPDTLHDQVGYRQWEPATVLMVRGQAEPFHHTDRNTLRRIGDATPNPIALAAAKARTAR